MLRRVSIAAALALLASGAAAADPTTRDPVKVPAGAFALDPRHASLVVKIPHMGFSHYTLRFTKLEGAFTYDPANWQATKVTITVDPKSIDTEDSIFNKTVAGYFEPDKYPTIQFTSTSLTSDAEGRGQLTGDLTLHGVTRPVRLDVTLQTPDLNADRLDFAARGKLKRSDFGMTSYMGMVGDEVTLTIAAGFDRQR